MEIRNGGAMWTTTLLMFTAKTYKVNGQKHATCVERCLYDIYTKIPCLEMSGSNDLAVLNQVCFQTLFVVRHVNAIPNRRKGIVVQDFEKGRSQRLWFRRYDR